MTIQTNAASTDTPTWDNDGRAYRNELLSATDWMVAVDSPLSAKKKAAVLKYRQELRDMTLTYLDYSKAVFPTQPTYP